MARHVAFLKVEEADAAMAAGLGDKQGTWRFAPSRTANYVGDTGIEPVTSSVSGNDHGRLTCS
jgi:hypothetical protein